jgi:NADH-quinone oxidoreductase subunit M
MVNHGVSTGALFLFVGWIYERRHTRQIADLNGLQKVAPIFAAGLHGRDAVVDRRARPQRVRRRVPDPHRFVPHRPLVDRRRRVGVILAALYLLWAYQRVFHGEPDEENKNFPELR